VSIVRDRVWFIAVLKTSAIVWPFLRTRPRFSQQRCQYRERHLAVGERDRAEGDDHVVDQRDHRGHPPLEVEAERHVDEDPGHPRQDRVEGLELEIAADLGPDRLDPPDLELADRGRQRLLGAPRELLERLPRQLGPNQVLLRIAEPLNDRAAELDAVQRGPDLLDLDGLGEPHLDQRAAREVDARRQPALVRDVGEAQEREPDRDRVGDPALADEVVVCVREDLEHEQARSRCARAGGAPCRGGRRAGG
jgi:hypothetical protein